LPARALDMTDARRSAPAVTDRRTRQGMDSAASNHAGSSGRLLDLDTLKAGKWDQRS